MSDKATNPRNEPTIPGEADQSAAIARPDARPIARDSGDSIIGLNVVDEDGHIPTLGPLCDCARCLREREVDRIIDALAMPVHLQQPMTATEALSRRTRDPATVTDIATARARAMPTFLGVDWAKPGADRTEYLGDFLGRVPQLTFRERVDAYVRAHPGRLLFWGLCAGFALAVWLGVR